MPKNNQSDWGKSIRWALGHPPVLGILLNNKANLCERYRLGHTPLHIAALDGHVEATKLLLCQNANVNEQNDNGVTPLHYAVQNGHEVITKLLVDAGADVHTALAGQFTSLHLACLRDDAKVVKILLEADPSLINLVTSDGETPLVYALMSERMTELWALNAEANKNQLSFLNPHLSNSFDCVELLLHAGADVFINTKNGCSVLNVASMCANTDVVQSLLLAGEKVDTYVEPSFFTPLDHASQRGDSGIVKILLNAGADVNTNRAGRTALHLASVMGHASVIRCLVEAGANVNCAAVNGGLTPLHLIAGAGSVASLEFLLQSGAWTDAQCLNGLKPLDYALMAQRKDVVQILLREEPRLLVVCQDMESVLDFAASEGNVNVVTELLEEGCDPSKRDTKGLATWDYSLQGRHFKVTKMLLKVQRESGIVLRIEDLELLAAVLRGDNHDAEHAIQCGANVNLRDDEGRSMLYIASEDVCVALHFAARSGPNRLVELLLSSGAKPLARAEGFIPLFYAIESQDLPKIRMLMDAIMSPVGELFGIQESVRKAVLGEAIFWAAQAKNVEPLSFLLNGETGVDWERQDTDGCTALQYASNSGSAAVVRYILDREAEVDRPDPEGRTALHYAASKGYVYVLQELVLMANGNVGVKAEDDITTLIEAASGGHAAAVSTLLDAGADVNDACRVQDATGWTALHCASFGGFSDVINVLLVKGADLRSRTSDGLTPLLVAITASQPEAVKCLLHNGALVGEEDNLAPLYYASESGHVAARRPYKRE